MLLMFRTCVIGDDAHSVLPSDDDDEDRDECDNLHHHQRWGHHIRTKTWMPWDSGDDKSH